MFNKPLNFPNVYLYKTLKTKDYIGASGFEPPTSWSRTKRASQTALRPVLELLNEPSLCGRR